MAIQCSQCGEELLGAVNRCWRCGHEFRLPPESDDLPPVRRSPVEIAVPADVLWDEDPPTAEPVDSTSADQATPVRRGSPFADSFSVEKADAKPAPSPKHDRFATRPPTHYAQYSAATGGAIGSVLLGILSVAAAWFVPLGAFITAILGVAMGTWGIYSNRRGTALAGLVLCCVALAIAGFFGAVELYTLINGHSPWEVEPVEADSFSY